MNERLFGQSAIEAAERDNLFELGQGIPVKPPVVQLMPKTTASKGTRCPYCGKERPRQRVSECYYCHKPIFDEYILLIDEDGEKFGFCSAKCMDLLFEYMEAEEFDEEE